MSSKLHVGPAQFVPHVYTAIVGTPNVHKAGDSDVIVIL